MGMQKPLFIVMTGDGINCERETAFAIGLGGGSARIMHVSDLLEAPEILKEADGFAIPGGFSFGDELGSGQIMALKIAHKLGDAFFALVERQKPVIGICNGFQVLVKLGLLPYPAAREKRLLALAPNAAGGFIDRWVEMEVAAESVCRWTQGLGKARIELPIRHGEGRIALLPGHEDEIYHDLKSKGLIPLTYAEDVNGSYGRIAALTDPTGMVLGMMPHPEAFVFGETYKQTGAAAPSKGDGLLLFENIIHHMNGRERADARRAG
jgi:phosphoribosylformylglycinamidine synthase